MLKLAFADRIQYDRFEGAITPEISFPFKALGGITDPQVCFGAKDGSDLEPSDIQKSLEELENWAEILKGEPEVIHRLAAFAKAERDTKGDFEDAESCVAQPEEPCP